MGVKGRKWKCPTNPKITLFMRVARTTLRVTCSHCHQPIEAGAFFIKLSATYRKFNPEHPPRGYWYFHLGGDCFNAWLINKLKAQVERIKKERGYNPLDYPPWNPKYGKLPKNIK